MPASATADCRSRRRRDAIEVLVAGRPVISLEPSEGRVRVGLVMHPLDRVVDVSVQPAAACAALHGAGQWAPSAPGAVEAAARAALCEARQRCSSWAPPDSASLLAGFGGAAFPLLAAAYDSGAAPVDHVPRWAEPIVAARSARDGATTAFGTRATRPVVRALVEAIRPVGSVDIDFANLALALMGRDVLEPDAVARVLSADRPAHPVEHLPDPGTLDAARRTVTSWGPVRAERVLLDAAREAEGLKLLLDTVGYARQLRGHGPGRLPNRLADLHLAHRIRVATAPPPPPRRPAPAPAPAPAPCAARAAEPTRLPHRLIAPPTDLAAVGSSAVLPVGPALLALEGHRVGDLTFRVPRSAGDLERWGRVLSNCLGGFAPSVRAHRSTIIGVERANVLESAVEIGADGAIRQFAGHANRAPADDVRRATVRALAEGGLLSADHPRNAPWLADLAEGR